jgi:hypothetical protein
MNPLALEQSVVKRNTGPFEPGVKKCIRIWRLRFDFFICVIIERMFTSAFYVFRWQIVAHDTGIAPRRQLVNVANPDSVIFAQYVPVATVSEVVYVAAVGVVETLPNV